MSNLNVINISNLEKSFSPIRTIKDIFRLRLSKKEPIKALEDINFQLSKGKILGILGPNGAGKTTLLKCICSLLIPDKGKVEINLNYDNKRILNLKSHFGFVDNDERSFYWRLSGMQNLEFYSALYGLNKKQASNRINKLLSIFNINYIHKRFDSYSTGMRRKISLIRAIIHKPQILLIDELSKSLDFNTSSHLNKFIKDLSLQGTTIILTSHNISEAENLCNTFMFLDQGKQSALGCINDLRNKYKADHASLTDIYRMAIKNA